MTNKQVQKWFDILISLQDHANYEKYIMHTTMKGIGKYEIHIQAVNQESLQYLKENGYEQIFKESCKVVHGSNITFTLSQETIE